VQCAAASGPKDDEQHDDTSQDHDPRGGGHPGVAPRLAPEPASEPLRAGADRLAGAESLQILGEGQGRRVARGGVLGEGLLADDFEVAVDVGLHAPRWNGVGVLDFVEHLGERA